MRDIPAELTLVFHEVFENPSIILQRQTTAQEVENWDSLMHIQLVVAVERKFGIRFGAGEIEKLQNVGDMMDLIGRKLNPVA